MSSQIYNTHSISFDDDNTWDRWHLLPTSRPHVAPPEVKTEYIEIPGMHGALDYTEALAGRPTFSNRKGSWEFYALTKMDGADQLNWAELYTDMLMQLHGQRKERIILREDDPLFYYSGRLSIKDWKSNKERPTVSIDYVIDPYKTPIVSDLDQEWQWNELFGISQIIYGTFEVSGSKFRTIINASDSDVQIKTDSTARMTAEIYESENSDVVRQNIIIPAGITEDTSTLIVHQGRTKIRFQGYGTIKLYYERGRRL